MYPAALQTHTANSNKWTERFFLWISSLSYFPYYYYSLNVWQHQSIACCVFGFQLLLRDRSFPQAFSKQQLRAHSYKKSLLASSSPFNYRANFQPAVYTSLLISYSSFRTQQSCEHRTQKRAHISLHWLAVGSWITFKILILAYKCVHGFVLVHFF